MNQFEGNVKIEDVIEGKLFYAGTTSGVSMYPMLRHRRDTIVVRALDGRLKKYDIPVYKVNDRYIMHRVIKVLPEAYIIRGDNCVNKEYVTDDMIIGKLDEFYRNPKDVSAIKQGDAKPVNMNGIGYKLYVRVWHYSFPIRLMYKKVRHLLGRVKRAVKRLIKRG